MSEVRRSVSPDEWPELAAAIQTGAPHPILDTLDGAALAVDSRDLDIARCRAEEALHDYAEALKLWNAPDHEHSRITLRNLAENAINEVLR